MHEGLIDHILLHCAKTRTLWALFFTLFGLQWVLPASVKMTLLGWDGSFVRKKRREVWRVDPICIFLMVWKARNRIAFEDNVLSIQRLKRSFVYFLWSETKLFIKDGPSTFLVSLIGWDLNEGGFFGCSAFDGCFFVSAREGGASLLYFFESLF